MNYTPLKDWLVKQPKIEGTSPSNQPIDAGTESTSTERGFFFTPSKAQTIYQRIVEMLKKGESSAAVGLPTETKSAYNTTSDPLGRKRYDIVIDGTQYELGQIFGLISAAGVDRRGKLQIVGTADPNIPTNTFLFTPDPAPAPAPEPPAQDAGKQLVHPGAFVGEEGKSSSRDRQMLLEIYIGLKSKGLI